MLKKENTDFKRFRDTRYYVSQEGEVYSEFGSQWVNSTYLKKIHPSIQPSGYLRANLSLGKGITKTMLIHHVVAEVYLGPRPEGKVINHLNGIKTDNRPSNLEYCTQKQNMEHAKGNGLLKGNSSYSSNSVYVMPRKLTAKQVVEIRKGLEGKRTAGIKHGVSESVIRGIRRGEIYKWVIDENSVPPLHKDCMPKK